MIYDNILFGNGLTIATIKNITDKKGCDKLSDYNNFLDYFFNLPNHARIKRNFYKLFGKPNNPGFNDIEQIIIDNLPNIKERGFERWGSKNILSKEWEEQNTLYGEILMYLQLLFNFWYVNYVDTYRYKYINELDEIASKLKQIVKGNFFTINFDLLFDDLFNCKHIHGKFANPLTNIANTIAYTYKINNVETIEFSYLFGECGVDKKTRLTRSYENNCQYYDYEFMFGDVGIGNLLIFGLSFGTSDVFSIDKECTQYSKDNNLFIYNSVDGHIIERLEELYMRNKINSITISYHFPKDLEHYKEIFNGLAINNIIEYKMSEDIINI